MIYSIKDIKNAIDSIPRISFANIPTPLQPCKNLSKSLGVNIYIKRDDLTGVAFGGNKTRNLEFRLAEVIEQSCDTVVFMLDVVSNSARQTVAAANSLGLKTVLILKGPIPEKLTGNLLLDYILGADVHLAGDVSDEEADAYARKVCKELEGNGLKPFYMNDSPIFSQASCMAYILCFLEILEQSQTLGFDIDGIYMTSGGKGQAGLLLASKGLNKNIPIVGIDARPYPKNRKQTTVNIGNSTAKKLNLDIKIDEQDVLHDDKYALPSYGVPSDETIETIRLLALTEGILLDPVYTGKGFSGLVDKIKSGEVKPNSNIVFVHTGGHPALFATQEFIDVFEKIYYQQNNIL